MTNTFILPKEKIFINRFISMFQKCGNKQRALSIMHSLLTKLKLSIAGYPVNNNFPLSTLKEKDPYQIINRCLYILKPAFILRQHFKAGKRFDLPVPISEKRATFMAMYWLCKTVLKNNKNEYSFATLLAQEISATLYQEGSAKNFLKAYVDIAFDQLPFITYIKRRRYIASKSKGKSILKRLRKINGVIRQTIKAHRYRGFWMARRLKIHNMRHIVTSRSKRKAPKVKFLQKNSKHKRKLKKFNYKR